MKNTRIPLILLLIHHGMKLAIPYYGYINQYKTDWED